MRRVLAWLFVLSSAISFILFVVVWTLWIMSYRGEGRWVLAERVPESVQGVGDFSEYRWEITSSAGRLCEKRMHVHRYWAGNTVVEPGWWPRRMLPPSGPTIANRLGFGIDYRGEMEIPYPGAVVTVWRDVWMPHWLVAVLAALLPGWCFASAAKAFLRRRRGQCLNCGYDLHATPERCPECGTERTLAV